MVKTLTTLALLLAFAASAFGQNWSGILSSARAAPWQANVAGGQGVAGGIPARTVICSTLTSTATAATINSAIAACPSGEVVFLSAGTYSITAPIVFNEASGVTLRGAGDMQTKVVLTGAMTGGGCITGYAMICLEGAGNGPVDAVTVTEITAGLSQGSTSITVSSTSGMAVGQILVLDQCNAGLSGYTTFTGRGTAGATCATGSEPSTPWLFPQVTWCQKTDNVCSTEGADSGDDRLNLRTQEQLVKITSISGTTVNFEPGLVAPNWSTSSSAEAWTWGTIAQTDALDGIESFTIDYGGCTNCADGLGIFNGDEDWVKGMRFIGPADRNNIWIYGAYGTEVRDNYFWGSNGASESYGVETFWGSNALVLNNIMQHIVDPILNGFSMNNVEAFNYSYDNLRNDFPDSVAGFIINHDAGGGYNLYEGNQGQTIEADTFHGNEAFDTFYRNVAVGNDTTDFPYLSECVIPINLWALNEFDNIIGNALGSSWSTVYQVTQPSNFSVNHGIFVFGQGNACGTPIAGYNDPNLVASTMLWGNYDTVSAATHWCGNSSDPGWSTICTGVTSATYTSGGTITGSSGETCNINFSGTATGIVTLTGTNAIASGTSITILYQGQNYSSAPTSGTLETDNSATCSGTATVSTTIGGVSEVPTGLTDYANSVPSSTTLPASFIFNSQPAFWETAWGTPLWPTIGPDVTGGTGPGGHSYLTPAGLAFANTPIDSAYQYTCTLTDATFTAGSPSTMTFTFASGCLTTSASEVTVSGVDPAGYNGTFSAASVTATTAVVDMSGTTPGTYVSGGTLTYPNIRAFEATTAYPGDFGGGITAPQQLKATPTQVVIGYTCPSDSTVAAALDNGSGTNLTPLAYDVDPTKFTNANDQEDRYPGLSYGNYKAFVIGTVPTPGDSYPALASNGISYSRALQQDSLYNVQVTCGSEVSNLQVHTAQLPPGNAYHPIWPIASPGNYATPTPTFQMGSSVIDPSTGVTVTELTVPGIGQTETTFSATSETLGTNWTNPADILLTSSSFATYSATTNDKIGVTFSSLEPSNIGFGSYQFDGYAVSFQALDTTSGEKMDVCFSMDVASGQCAPGANTVQYTLGTTAATIVMPGGGSSFASTITPIDTTFVPYQNYEGSTASPGLTLNTNFGLLIWKASTDSSTLSVNSPSLRMYYSAYWLSPNGGENIPCSSQYIADSNGLNGVLCIAQTEGGSRGIFWVSDQTNPPTVRYVGDYAMGASVTISSATFDSGDLTVSGYMPFSDSAANNIYLVGTDTNSKVHVVECALPASGNSFWTGLYPNGSNTTLSTHACNNGSFSTLTDLTPISGNVLYDPSSTSDSLIDEFAAAFPGEAAGALPAIPSGCTAPPTNNFPCPHGFVGGFGVQNTQGNYVVISLARVQGAIQWLIVVNVNTNPATIAGMTNSWSNYVSRWSVDHTAHQTGDPDWLMETFDNVGGGAEGEGPYTVTLEAAMTSSQTTACVNTNTPSESTTGDYATQITAIQPNDIIQIASEKMLVTAITTTGSCSTGQYQLTVTRGVLGTTAAAQSSDASVSMLYTGYVYGNSGNNGQKFEWNFINAPYGDITGATPSSVFMGGFGLNSQVTANLFQSCTVTSECAVVSGYTYYGPHESYFVRAGGSSGCDIGEFYNYSCGLSNPGGTGNQYALYTTVPFAGNQAGVFNPTTGGEDDNEPHPAAAQGSQLSPGATSTPTIGVDEILMNVQTPFQCGTPAQVGESGTLYTCTLSSGTTGYTLNPYGPDIMAFDGVNPLVDISGPNSSIGSGTANNYEFCVVHVANECVSGSTVGTDGDTTVYFNDPNYSSSATCTFNGSNGGAQIGYFQNDCFYIGQMPMMMQGVQESELNAGPSAGAATINGLNFRYVSSCLTPFQLFQGFSTSHLFATNKFATCDSNNYGTVTMNGVTVREPREDIQIVQMPSWKPVSTPQYDFVWTPVQIPAPPASLGASTAEVDFGYDQNFYCASRQEMCAAFQTSQPSSEACATFSNSSCPFGFAGVAPNYAPTDSYTRPSCSSGCTILVPLIPNMVAYYQVRFFNSSGNAVSISPTKVLSAL